VTGGSSAVTLGGRSRRGSEAALRDCQGYWSSYALILSASSLTLHPISATFDLNAQRSNPAFVPGTVLDVYDAADGTGAMRPPKAKLTSVTVGSDGTVLITGLLFSHRYVAGTDINSVWTALVFTTDPEPLGTPIGPTIAINPAGTATVGTTPVTLFTFNATRAVAGFSVFHDTATVYVARGGAAASLNGEGVYGRESWRTDSEAPQLAVSVVSDTPGTPLGTFEV
jgi:hypothetical protein